MSWPRPTEFLGASVYGIVSLPVAIAWLTFFSSLVSVSVSLLVIGIGFILLSATLKCAGLAAGAERWLLFELLGTEIEKQPRQATGSGSLAVVTDPLRDGSYWRELAFISLRTVLGPFAFVVVVVTWAFPLFALSTIFWGWSVAFGIRGTLLFLLGGAVVTAIGPFIVTGISRLHVAVAHSLLGPSRRQLAEEVTTVQRTRDLSVGTAEAERRRIERDLHDGAQARLATVAMDLGRAKRKLEKEGGNTELEAIIDSAHGDAKAAIVELRDLARGIHPAVLTDRGLDAALSEIAARCTVPVHLDVQLAQRPPAHIESTAYFATSELLANVSKHSRAQNAWVTVRSDPHHLRIDVSDDGLGGVDPTLGTGVHGIRDRIASIDGTLSFQSPLGGGTSALVEIPLKRMDG